MFKRAFRVFVLSAFVSVPIMIPTPPVEAAHVVQPGDAFWKIAGEYHMSLADLIKLNPHIENPSRINPGDKMVVRSGDVASDIVDYARALQGVTVYQYGGQSAPELTDCSGWVQAIYKEFGIDLPRVSRDQAKVGKPIKFQDMRKGDLMFFSTREDKVITHVGIYMSDDFWISNLSTKQDVEVLSTFGPWTQKYFLWAQRVI
jgi:cell wall-associated NlpC family hydrolase